MTRILRRPHGRLIAIVATLAAVLGLVAAGTASARGASNPGVSIAVTAAVPGLNTGESARFQIIDTGRSIIVIGRGWGMAGARSYVSLLYPDGGCATPEPTAGLTLGGAWQARGESRQDLYERFEGYAYKALRGHIGSVSVREITAASNAGAGNFSLTATARACASLKVPR